jgi:hypothetical protein
LLFNLKDGEKVKAEISGGINHSGILIESNTDVVVIYNGEEYLYIPLMHIQHLKADDDSEEIITLPESSPYGEDAGKLSLRKVLTNSKGIFVEIFVTNHQSIHGYVTNVLNDYFSFYSPVYKTMLISLNHLKWLIPYDENQTPYSLNTQDLPVMPSSISLSRTFAEQLKKLTGKVVIFDLGKQHYKIGQLKEVTNNFVELITAKDEPILINLRHIKTVHLPNEYPS